MSIELGRIAVWVWLFHHGLNRYIGVYGLYNYRTPDSSETGLFWYTVFSLLLAQSLINMHVSDL